jgi:hypothetical protein
MFTRRQRVACLALLIAFIGASIGFAAERAVNATVV